MQRIIAPWVETEISIHVVESGKLDNNQRQRTITCMSDIGPHLLLVDDEPNLIFQQVSHVFAPRGAQIQTVRNGNDAIGSIAKQLPDVVLLDISLPDLGGLEVYHRIR